MSRSFFSVRNHYAMELSAGQKWVYEIEKKEAVLFLLPL